MLKKVYYIFILFVLFTSKGFATHNRAGEITYKQIYDYTYEFTITTFTNTKPTSNGIRPADRPQLEIKWGDGTYSVLRRTGEYILSDGYKKNVYVGRHTYLGASTYKILVEDPNRNEGVENIPNSVMVVFSIKTILQINPMLGFNNTPLLLNPPIDKAAVNRVFIHNPSAFDPDGDSLSYEMTVCSGEGGKPIENYTFPPSKNRPIYIDSINGNLIWDTPTKAGIYNVAFNILEWRKGIKIGQITRDMQIEVYNTNNNPPEIDSIHPICITAGDVINLNITAQDKDNDIIKLEATGGVFQLDQPPIFTSTPTDGTVNGIFKWNTKCLHVREQPYNIVFKATDDNKEVNLVDQMSVDITVVGSQPQGLKLTPSNNSIELSWNSYPCSYHKGFYVYRSITPYGFTPAKCETGVPAYTGFKRIATITDNTSTSYLDNNNQKGLNQGFKYCYIITAFYNSNLESKASDEVCTELVRGTPIITNVSVTEHSIDNGKIYLAWSKPIDFDTVKYPGKLFYIIKRADSIWGENYTIIDTLFDFNTDTIFIDSKINTLNNGYSYRVEIHNKDGITEQPMTASSIFPKLTGKNRQIEIFFDKNVPWINTEYIVYKQNKNNIFDSIGYTNNNTFTDKNLNNGDKYCYRIKSNGKYNLSGIIKPIINYSHQNCGIPIDTIPPTPPVLNVVSDCDKYINTLSWSIDSISKADVLKYYIYSAESFNGDFKIIDSVLHKDTLQYIHKKNEVLGVCYAVSAVDSNQNNSKLSNIVCVDNCSVYELPNVFTPNGDNVNDVFIPITPPRIINTYIESIDLKIYSRWGNLVYKTTNPLIQWDGKSNTTSSKLVKPGVYYYVCDVYEKRISGIEHNTLTGFIHIFYNEDEKK